MSLRQMALALIFVCVPVPVCHIFVVATAAIVSRWQGCKKKLSTAVAPSSHCLNCPRADGELVSKFTDGLADAPRSETRVFGKLLGEHHRPSRPVRCPAWLEVKDTAGGALGWG